MAHPSTPIVHAASEVVSAMYDAAAAEIQDAIARLGIDPDTPMTPALQRRIMQAIEPTMRRLWGTRRGDEDAGVSVVCHYAVRLAQLQAMQPVIADIADAVGPDVFTALDAEAIADGP